MNEDGAQVTRFHDQQLEYCAGCGRMRPRGALLEAPKQAVTSRSGPIPASSSGKTAGLGPANEGSTPSAGAIDAEYRELDDDLSM